MGETTTTIFGRLRHLDTSSPSADEAAAAVGVLPHISSVVAAAAAEAAAAKAAAEAIAAAEAAADAERAAAEAGVQDGEAAAAGQGGGEAGEDGGKGVSRRISASGGGVLPQPGSPVRRGASAIAAAAAAAAANGMQPLHGSSVAPGSDSLSEAAATADSTAAAHSVSTDALGSEEGGDEEGRGTANSSITAAARGLGGSTAGGEDGSSPFKPGRGPQRGLLFGHGLPCAVEVLSFLIECVARRGEESTGGVLSPVDEDYVVFGLQMAHRALLAGGPVLADHDSLLSLIHK